MKEQDHCTLGLCPGTTENGAIVSIAVSPNHPLLQLKRALPWEALCEVMTRHWRRAGKNTEGRPGLPWDVALVTVQVVTTGLTPPLATSGRFWGAEMERLHHARRLHARR